MTRVLRMTGLGLTVCSLGVALLLAPVTAWAQAQQVPIPEEPSTQPQIEVDGTGIVTLQAGRTKATGGHTGNNGVDFSDSALVFGAAQRLYRRGAIGSMAFGFLTPGSGRNDVSGKTELFVHQAFADYQSRDVEAYLGRTNQPSAQLIQFPTVREEDLITFTHLLNPFSSGENSEENRYANVGSATFNQKLTHFENVYVQHLLNTAPDAGGAGLNTVGAMYQYLSPPGLEPVQRVINYGFGYERRSVPAALGGSSNALFGGGVLNIRRSLVRRIDLRIFGTATFGNDTQALNNVPDTYRADSRSVAAAVRYLRTPFGLPSSQVALTVGYRTYPRVSGSHSYGAALTGVKRIGQGFDVVAQYSYEQRNGALATASGGRTDQTVHLGFVFNFNSTFNKFLTPRRTLLNVRHEYIP